MKNLIPYLFTALALVATTGCKKSRTSCESIYQHTVDLAPADFKSALEQDKDNAIAKCETLPEDTRKCAADAETFEALAACKPPRHAGP
ncbi:MAG TPA: hypothetical protein VMJ10_10255 [Kofleriaceae bacterium]|nr:hypothetical protein [Kofleriaceae bacterium]